MKRKIVGIFVMTLLIATTVLPVTGTVKEDNGDSFFEETESSASDLLEMNIDPSDNIVSDNLDLIIDISNPKQISFENYEYHIYEGLHWRLYVTAGWDPPIKQMCLWLSSSLPAGATFPECNCAYGSVTSTLDWTPAVGQAGTYYITFSYGENCYNPVNSVTVKVVVHPYEFEPQETYEIYAGQEWHLELTAYWVPPQPDKLICLWVVESTLPYGATFTDCHCDYGEVTSDLYWTPTLDQVGEYIIVPLIGDTCGYYEFPYPIEVIVIEPEISGISFSQIDYVFADGETIMDSYMGDLVVDIGGLTSYYGIAEGYLNIRTAIGWVVQNLLITDKILKAIIPFIDYAFQLRVGPFGGISVSTIDAYIDFTPSPIKNFNEGPYASYPVSSITHYIESDYFVPDIPIPLIFPCFPTDFTCQFCHQNVQAADSQCGPCACANSLQWLEDKYEDIEIPHELEPGTNGDNTLPGQMDDAMGRQPGKGVNTQHFVEGKLRYLEKHGLGQKIKTKHCNVWESEDYSVGNLTSKDMGKITKDWIIDEIEAGEDVELKIRYPGGGTQLHWVEVVAAGYICGKPFIIHLSDHQQEDDDPDNNDGCDKFDFEWLEDDGNGVVTLQGGHSSVGTRIDSVVSQSPNNPPNNIAATYDKDTDELVVKATDPQGDKVRYGIDWDGDGKIDEWTDYVPSGTTKRIDCNGRTGSAGIVVEDEFGARSDMLSVKSKNKSINNPFLHFLERHPHMFPLLRLLLNLPAF